MKSFLQRSFRGLIPLLSILALLVVVYSCTPKSSVRQQQIDRERERKEKQALKAYKKEVELHYKKQSKTTKAMMRKTRRECRKTSPHRK